MYNYNFCLFYTLTLKYLYIYSVYEVYYYIIIGAPLFKIWSTILQWSCKIKNKQ